MNTTQSLDEIMEFDHVIIVHDDGTITDAPNDRKYWEPSLLDGELDSSHWEFFTTGYSGQDSYSGPIMHDSEYIGGRLEHDIRNTPGVYVALVSQYSDVCALCHEDYVTNDDGTLSHQNARIDDDHDASDAETYLEGWAIARLKDEYAND